MNVAYRLPALLDADDLPPAELNAAAIDGELVRLGPVFMPIDLPGGRESRARSLRRALPQRLIADRRTAAWIHGASAAPPSRLEACMRSDARATSLPLGEVSVREVVIEDHEILHLGGVSVTAPMRTVLDLIRSPDFDASLAVLARALAAVCDISLSECERDLARRRHLPKKGQALQRLRGTLG